MSRILVTGGAGFMGSHLVDHLINDGHKVTVIDDLSGGKKENVNPKAKFVKNTINNKKVVDKLVKGKDIIFHLSCYAAEGLSHFIRKFNYENNLIGSINLINSAVRHKIKRFIHLSSMSVYGTNQTPFDESFIPQPEDPYGISKLAVELDIKAAHDLFGMDYCILRAHNVYGHRQHIGDKYRNVLGIWMNQIMHNKRPTIFGDGKQIRAFSYVDDITPCIARAAFSDKARNQIINIGAAESITINKACKLVLDAMGSKLKPIHLPPRYEVKYAHCTIDKSVKLLGYKTTVPLKEGIKRMAEWAKEKGPQKTTKWKSYELYKKIPKIWLK